MLGPGGFESHCDETRGKVLVDKGWDNDNRARFHSLWRSDDQTIIHVNYTTELDQALLRIQTTDCVSSSWQPMATELCG